ncbi:vWA domain-containing protein [Vibrio breoganii]|uniref:vWA domain-containing protein n=1 Tax=Vibrio breoganii TaxID=553239 RepID=UPI000C836829|nr:hypothetical protein [Vibrio breoganii]PML12721.1 hypothetical protein BCT84_02230 [Vibrio breoganii]
MELYRLAMFANTFTKIKGISLKVGDEVHSDMKQVVIPKPVEGSEYLSFTYLGKEASKLRWSNFTALDKLQNEQQKQLAFWAESTRLDRKWQELWPGMRSSYEKVSRQTFDESAFFELEDCDFVRGYIYHHVRCASLNYDHGRCTRDFDGKLRSLLGVARFNRMRTLLSIVPKLSVTRDSVTWSEYMIEFMGHLPVELGEYEDSDGGESEGDEQLQDDQQGESDNSQAGGSEGDEQSLDEQQGESADSQGDGSEGDEQSQGDQQGESSEAQGVGSQNSQSSGGDLIGGEQAPDSEAIAAENGIAVPTPQELMDSESEILVEAVNANADTDSLLDKFKKEVNKLSPDLEVQLREKVDDERVQYTPAVTGLQRQAFVSGNTLREYMSEQKRVKSALMKHRQFVLSKKKEISRNGKRINTKRVARLRQGDVRVFSRTLFSKGNTRVDGHSVVLLDTSASMSSCDLIARASRACHALLGGLNAIDGMSTSCLTFGGTGNRIVHRVKEEREKVTRKMVERFEAISPAGGTPLASGLWSAMADVALSDKEVGDIYIVTDGYPNDAACGFIETREAVMAHKATGGRVYCIQILNGESTNASYDAALSALFGTGFVQIADQSELSRSLLEVSKTAVAV